MRSYYGNAMQCNTRRPDKAYTKHTSVNAAVPDTTFTELNVEILGGGSWSV